MDTPEKSQTMIAPILRSFLIAIKNNLFYPTGHPLCCASVYDVQHALEDWFFQNSSLNLELVGNGIRLCGESDLCDDPYSAQIAKYLHGSGLLSIAFDKDVQFEELTTFFQLIVRDREGETGGESILERLNELENIRAEELDYQSVLELSDGSGSYNGADGYRVFLRLSKDRPDDELPETSIELLKGFFKDAQNASNILMTEYDKAVRSLSNPQFVKDIRKAIVYLCRELDYLCDEESQDMKIDLLHVMSKLHPDFIDMLFDVPATDDPDSDLAKHITHNLSENEIGEFLASLIHGERSINERFLRLFDHLASDAPKMQDVISIATDRLLKQNMLKGDLIEQLKTSVKELLLSNPGNDFLSMMYKITIDSVINKNYESLSYVVRLSPLIAAFVRSAEGNPFLSEKTYLLLNLLKMESDRDTIRRLTDVLWPCIDGYLQENDVKMFKEVLWFYSICRNQHMMKNPEIGEYIDTVLAELLGDERIERIVSMIPEAKEEDLNHIACILQKAPHNAADLLIRRYVQESHSEALLAYTQVIRELKHDVVGKIKEQIYSENPAHIHKLFLLLKAVSPESAEGVFRSAMAEGDRRLLKSGLKEFTPASKEDADRLFQYFKSEKSAEMQKRLAAALLKSDDLGTMMKMIRCARRSASRRMLLPKIISLCGDLATESTFRVLRTIWLWKPLFPGKVSDDMKIESAKNMLRCRREEAASLIQDCMKSQRRRVRNALRSLLQKSQRGAAHEG